MHAAMAAYLAANRTGWVVQDDGDGTGPFIAMRGLGDMPTDDEINAWLVERLFTSLRAERGNRLSATDKYLLPDYPITADALEQVKAYRAALRDLPDQPGAPWDGGGELTPWPELPKT